MKKNKQKRRVTIYLLDTTYNASNINGYQQTRPVL